MMLFWKPFYWTNLIVALNLSSTEPACPTMENIEKSKRSTTLVRETTEEKLATLHVEFDNHNWVIGENQSKFATCCGVTDWSRISILKESWDKVSKSEVNDLWLDIKVWYL